MAACRSGGFLPTRSWNPRRPAKWAAVLEKLDLIATWIYEDWSHNNFQTDPLGTNFASGPEDIYLNNRVDNYDAHIIMLSARYEF